MATIATAGGRRRLWQPRGLTRCTSRLEVTERAGSSCSGIRSLRCNWAAAFSAMIRNTLARLMLSAFTMSLADFPSALRRMTSADCFRAVGCRPRYFPSALALAIPSRCRSSINSRSNSAIDPRRFTMSFPVGVPVSRFMDSTRSATAFFLSVAVIATRSATERARRSSLVTTRTSPSRTHSRAASS